MYGIIFKTIQGAVLDQFDEKTWDQILSNAGIDNSYFISTENYDDDLMYRIADSAEEILKIDQKDILELIGGYWVNITAKTKYLDLIQSGGKNYKEFLLNLPFLHSRIIMMYPKIADFDFEITKDKESNLLLCYITSRTKLEYFLLGVLKTLAEFFSEKVQVDLIESKTEGAENNVYKLTWI